jgi:methylmalonyl-CoA mutase N-terminal domain/subunit
LALPKEQSVRTALRTQQIVAYESGVTNTIDPLAGSYYLETMTDMIEKGAEEYISKIDGMGGMIKAIENGYVQREIQKASYDFEKDMEAGKRVIVGLNKFTSGEEKDPQLLKIDMKVQDEQINFLNKTKNNRDQQKVDEALADLKRAAGENKNLMPYIIEAVRTYASVGEICNTMRIVFGEYKEQVVI